ncbi:hypothetical protein AMECASPLE_037751 [Ameca splendens]|uniref:Uncharacterized protein n=1 Tax=Ameca splendens TaxID=208324 RepID=A0ABV0XL69_9TELE
MVIHYNKMKNILLFSSRHEAPPGFFSSSSCFQSPDQIIGSFKVSSHVFCSLLDWTRRIVLLNHKSYIHVFLSHSVAPPRRPRCSWRRNSCFLLKPEGPSGPRTEPDFIVTDTMKLSCI